MTDYLYTCGWDDSQDTYVVKGPIGTTICRTNQYKDGYEDACRIAKALNDEANDHAHAAAIAEARATRAEELLAFLAACTDELPVQFRQILAPFRIAPTEGNPE